jgi:3',5'-cyclic-AMP phosphodiesterase
MENPKNYEKKTRGLPNGEIDRRGFLECMQWVGTGLLWTFGSGVPASRLLGAPQEQPESADFTFVQISDSHIGFNGKANADVTETFQVAVDKINSLDRQPELILHTGDLTHLAKAEEFDTLDQLLRGLKQKQVFFVPGEHDLLGDQGARYLERFGKGTKERGWQSFDHKGIHFIGLNNSAQLDGLGSIGEEQLAWLKDDVSGQQASTPIVVFAHIPLWAVYPKWGWDTKDGAQALEILKRFGSVTVLNGHIHQTLQKVEGDVTFYSAMSTAFPQPAPGSANAPGPMAVPAEELRKLLGIRQVNYVAGPHRLAVVDSTLSA